MDVKKVDVNDLSPYNRKDYEELIRRMRVKVKWIGGICGNHNVCEINDILDILSGDSINGD